MTAEAPVTDPAGRPPEDLRLVPAAVSSWGVAALAVVLPPVVDVVLGAALLVPALGVVLPVARAGRRARRVRAGRGRPTLVAALAAAGVVALCAAPLAAQRDDGLLPDLVDRAAVVQVTAGVASDPHQVATSSPGVGGAGVDGPPRWTARLRVSAVTGRGVSSSARARMLAVGGQDVAGLVRDSTVVLVGRLVPTDPGDDLVALLQVQGGVRSVSAPTGWRAVAAHLRDGLRRSCAGLPPDAAGLVPGLVVGDTSALPGDLESAMRTTGLTHLTAVSGGNIAVLTGAVLLTAGVAGLRRRLRTAAAGVALVGFVALVGPEASVLRAGVMAAVGLVGLVAARPGRGMPALSAAVVVLLVADPWLARSPGLALSVLATAGLLLGVRPVSQRLARVLPSRLATAVSVPLVAQLACAPVLVLLAPQVSLVAVPANLLAAPAVVPVTVVGVLALVVTPASAGAGALLAAPAGWAASWIAVVARTGAGLPGAVLPWPAGWPGAALLVAVLVGAALGVAAAAAAVRAVARGRARPAGTWAVRPLRSRARRPLLVAAAAASAVVLAVLALPPVRERVGVGSHAVEDWVAVQCDVGQGDALAVRSGQDAAVVVDTGPDPAAVRRCLDDLGVERVDLLVLTHFHADHVEGLAGVLQGRDVVGALVSPLAEPEAAASAVAGELAAAGVPVTVGRAGQQGAAGDVAWRVLWPTGTSGGGGADEESRINDASVVVALRAAGLRITALGDLGRVAQAQLRRTTAADPDLWPVDVLKVAHHGSADQDPGLVRLAAPRAALVGVGANDYGHPTARTLDLLEQAGAVTACTQVLGDVIVTPEDAPPQALAEQASGVGLVVSSSRGDPVGRRC